MKKLIAILLLSTIIFASAFAQSESTEGDDKDVQQEQPQKKEKINIFKSKFNEAGDQYVKISIAAAMPMNFGGDFPIYKDGKLATGGSGEIGYHRFLTSWLTIGADVAFGYNPTLENNIYTWVPVMFNAAIHPAIGRFEFPVTVAVGFAYETYLRKNFFPAFVFKPEIAAYYRVSPSWSFGLEYQFMVMPQLYDNSTYNETGFFQNIGISARYHF